MGRITDIGFESSVGLLLNQCCVKCGVWIGIDEEGLTVEFNGMPHHCTPAQKRDGVDELELQIHTQAMLLHTAKTPKKRRAAMEELQRLHKLRSPERVALMELERGLR